jgi:hypothetical protein
VTMAAKKKDAKAMGETPEQRLASAVDTEFDQSMGGSAGEIALERAKAWDFYLQKPLGNEVEGESKVVTADVAEVVDSIMPSLLRIFTTADNLVSFDPVGEEDEAGAEQETDYVSHVFFKQNQAFLILYTWFFDALVQKNGVVKCYWDESQHVSTETYKGVSDEELAELMDDEELELVKAEERQEEQTVDVQTMLGVLPQKRVVTVHDLEFKRTSKSGRVCVANVPPEEYRISSDSRSVDPSNARMVGQEQELTRSDLLAMGFDKTIVKGLKAIPSVKQQTPESRARHSKSDEKTEDTAVDKSQDKILVREGYIKFDLDGDLHSELLQVFTASGKYLEHEEADRQPFHVISPQPLPHKHFGRATAEKVMDVQEVNTTLLRQVLNNLYHTNNPGHAVWEQGIGDNTLDDLLTTRVGRVARFARPVGESWAAMSIPFTAGATFPMLEFFDKVKRDRTGVSSDSQGLTPAELKNIQTTVLAQAADLSRMKIEAIARIFAETGIKSLFLHIHELLLKHQTKEQRVKLRNRWTRVNPQEWRTRNDMTVNIGLGIGTREQNLVHLNAIREIQRDIVAAGGGNLIVKPRNVYKTATQYVKNANLRQPDDYFTDPGDALAPPAPDQQKQLEALQAQLQQRQQILDMREQQLKIARLNLDSEAERLKHEREMEKIRLQREDIDNKLMLGMEQIRNALTDLELKYGQNVPGSAV